MATEAVDDLLPRTVTTDVTKGQVFTNKRKERWNAVKVPLLPLPSCACFPDVPEPTAFRLPNCHSSVGQIPTRAAKKGAENPPAALMAATPSRCFPDAIRAATVVPIKLVFPQTARAAANPVEPAAEKVVAKVAVRIEKSPDWMAASNAAKRTCLLTALAGSWAFLPS